MITPKDIQARLKYIEDVMLTLEAEHQAITMLYQLYQKPIYKDILELQEIVHEPPKVKFEKVDPPKPVYRAAEASTNTSEKEKIAWKIVQYLAESKTPKTITTGAVHQALFQSTPSIIWKAIEFCKHTGSIICIDKQYKMYALTDRGETTYLSNMHNKEVNNGETK